MNLQKTLLADIEAHLIVHGVTPTRFGITAVHDGCFVARLKAGRNMTLRTMFRVREYLDAHPAPRVAETTEQSA